MDIKNFKAVRLINEEENINLTLVIEANRFDGFMKASNKSIFKVEEVEVTEELLRGAQIYAPIPRMSKI